MFESYAEELIALCDGDPKIAVAKALGFISGVSSMTARSLLNGEENFITYQLNLGPVKTYRGQGIGRIWSVIKNRMNVPPKIHEQIMRMRTFKDNTGAVFDVRSQDAEEFEAAYKSVEDPNFSVEVCKSLPNLYEERLDGN